MIHDYETQMSANVNLLGINMINFIYTRVEKISANVMIPPNNWRKWLNMRAIYGPNSSECGFHERKKNGNSLKKSLEYFMEFFFSFFFPVFFRFLSRFFRFFRLPLKLTTWHSMWETGTQTTEWIWYLNLVIVWNSIKSKIFASSDFHKIHTHTNTHIRTQSRTSKRILCWFYAPWTHHNFLKNICTNFCYPADWTGASTTHRIHSIAGWRLLSSAAGEVKIKRRKYQQIMNIFMLCLIWIETTATMTLIFCHVKQDVSICVVHKFMGWRFLSDFAITLIRQNAFDVG